MICAKHSSRATAAPPTEPGFPVRSLSFDERADVRPVESPQERSSAAGWPHGLAGGGSEVKLGADIPFEPSELVDKRGLIRAEAAGSGLDGWEGHCSLEASQPVPSLEAAFDGTADVPGHVVAQLDDHLGV